MSKAFGLAAIACVVGAALPRPVAAQVEFTPFFASFYALTKTGDNLGGSDLDEKQIPAPGGGARLTFWLGSSFGIEGAGAIVVSGTRFTSDNPNTPAGVSLSGMLMTGSLRMLYRPARTNLHLLLGGGIVNRSGDSWEGFEGLLDFAGVAGLGVRAAVTPKIALNINLETYIYAMNPTSANFDYDSAMQTDIYLTIGVPISFGGR